eukprot:3253933-Rhodomonas_salina.3
MEIHDKVFPTFLRARFALNRAHVGSAATRLLSTGSASRSALRVEIMLPRVEVPARVTPPTHIRRLKTCCIRRWPSAAHTHAARAFQGCPVQENGATGGVGRGGDVPSV